MVRKACLLIDAINMKIAHVVSYVLVLMVLTISYEVLCRYLLNSPTDWALEINEYLLCAISMLGGGYAILKDEHVRVDVLYRYFPIKARAIAEFATWWIVVLFCLVIIWKGGEMSIEALVKGKKSMGIMEFHLFPSMVTVPLGAFLMLLQALVRIVRNILLLKTGMDEITLAKTRNE